METYKRGFEKISQNQYYRDFEEIVKKYFSGEYTTYEEIQLPRRATALSAGYDIFSTIDFQLLPNEDIKIPTGIKVYMQNDEVLKIYPRSGLGFRYYSRLANSVGIIDADYIQAKNEGHIWVKLRNEGTKPMLIKKGEAICQAIFEKYLLADWDSFEGEMRIGGFGSTSK